MKLILQTWIAVSLAVAALLCVLPLLFSLALLLAVAAMFVYHLGGPLMCVIVALLLTGLLAGLLLVVADSFGVELSFWEK